MLPAIKHFDPVVGIDTHIVLIPTPAGPIPTPVPTPFVGVMFDPDDYLPGGATVLINGLPRSTAGSEVKAVPHIPIGGPFLKPPANEGELFMGSSTVVVEGEPMGFAGLPVLTCQDIGLPAPFRASKSPSSKSLYLPTSIVLPIPTGPLVLIGGLPTISMSGLAMKLVSKASKHMVGLLKKSKLGKRLDGKMKGLSQYLNSKAGRVFKKLGIEHRTTLRNQVSHTICTVTGHPVDVATGKLFTNFVDFELPGPLPFKLERIWYSTSTYVGPLGHGWHASFDMALAEDDLVVAVRLGDGRVALFPALNEELSSFNARERLTLTRVSGGYRVLSADTGLAYGFTTAGRSFERAAPLSSVEDRDGRRIAFHSDVEGRITHVVDSGTRRWDIRYHPTSGRLAALEGPHPSEDDKRVVCHEWHYDEHHNLIETRDALGHKQRFEYRNHLLVRETNKVGLSFHFEWDGKDDNARCKRTWGDGGIYDHKLSYDLERNITTVENSLGYKTQYEHDGAMVHRTFDAYGNVRSTVFDDDYRVTAEVNELGQQTSFDYDERGNLSRQLSADGAEIRTEYDEHDLPVRLVDARGSVWLWRRDAQGRLLEKSDPLGNTTRYVYHRRWLVAVIDPTGAQTTLGYSPDDDVDAVVTPDGALSSFHRDRIGRVIATVDTMGNTQRRDLDLLGRPVRVREPDSNVRTLTYDAEGNVVRAQDAQQDVSFTYQGMNRLSSRSEAGTKMQFHYDTEEHLTSIVNEHGLVYRFHLGPTGEVDEEHGFDGLVRKYRRDAAGRVVRIDRPGERFTEYELDVMSRVTDVRHSDGSEENFQYDLDGSLKRAASQDMTVRFERDAVGRIVREEQDEEWLESEYDVLGRRVRMRSSLGVDQVIERNAMGDVSRVSEASSGFEARYKRNPLGLEIERVLPGGVLSRWQRDNTGRPLQHEVTAGEQTLRAVGYTWEVNDRLRRVVDGMKGATEYRHDALGNLAAAQYSDGSVELRMPDAVGNLFRTEQRDDREYGAAGQLLVARSPQGETRYAYDVEGNLVSKIEPSGACWQYAWNGAGMLASVRRPDGSVVSFAYDPLGRRVKKSYRGQTTRWVWDGDVPLHEWVEGRLVSLADAGGAPWSTVDKVQRTCDAELEAWLASEPGKRGSKAKPVAWLFEPESFAPMGRTLAAEVTAVVCDHLGTPASITDLRGVSVWGAHLGALGALRDRTGDRWACLFRWPGQYEDLETGLCCNRFRYYDPGSGQYASQDPLGLLGGAGLYLYVPDPLALIDPLGLTACGTLRSPKTVSFSQNSIGARFSDNGSLNELIERMRGDPAYAGLVEPIRLVRARDLPHAVRDKLKHQHVSSHSVFTLDNRRLLAARSAKVPVNARWATPDEISRFATPRRFSTTNGGGLPEIR